MSEIVPVLVELVSSAQGLFQVPPYGPGRREGEAPEQRQIAGNTQAVSLLPSSKPQLGSQLTLCCAGEAGGTGWASSCLWRTAVPLEHCLTCIVFVWPSLAKMESFCLPALPPYHLPWRP